MNPKLEKLKTIIELMQNDTITPAQLKAFLEMVLKTIKTSKDNLEAISQKNIKELTEALRYIEQKHKETSSEISQIKTQAVKDFETSIKEAKGIIKELKSIKLKDGKDGRDGIDGKDYVITPKDKEEIKLSIEEKLSLDIDGKLEGFPKFEDLDTINKRVAEFASRKIPIGLEVFKNGKNLGRFPSLNFKGGTVEASASRVDITLDSGGGSSSPLTTKGDLYTYSTVDARLPVGTNGQILSANSGTATGLEWVTSPDASVTVADVSANSTTTALSLYQMTAAQNVEFRASDTSTLLLLNETNKQVLFASGTVSLPGFAFAADTDSGFFSNGANNWAWSGGGTSRFTFSTLGITSTGSGFALARNHAEALPTYAMAGDTDTGMGTSAANTLAWSTGGTYRMYLDSTGLGIGTLASAKLHVLATTEQVRIAYDSLNYLPITVSSAGIPTFQPTGNSMVFKATAPAYIINVHQSDSTASAYRLGTYADSAESEYLYNGTAEAKISGRASSYIGLTSTNFFGVGTSTPGVKLHVLKGGSSLPAFDGETVASFTNTTAAGTNSQISIISGTTGNAVLRFGDTGSEGRGQIRYNNNTDGFELYTAAAVRSYLSSTGNFGVGVSPTHRIDSYLSSSSTGVSSIYGLRDIPSGTISSGSSINGVQGQLTVSGSTTISTITATGGDFIAEHDGSSTVHELVGLRGWARTNGASTGVLASAKSILASAPANSQVGNTITNAYSLYIESPTVGTALNYGLYQTGSALNYLGGNLGLGVASATEKLHINGNILFSEDATPTDRSIKVADQTTADTDGNILRLTGSAGNGAGHNGSILITSPDRTTATIATDLTQDDSIQINAGIITVQGTDIIQGASIDATVAMVEASEAGAGNLAMVAGSIQVNDASEWTGLYPGISYMQGGGISDVTTGGYTNGGLILGGSGSFSVGSDAAGGVSSIEGGAVTVDDFANYTQVEGGATEIKAGDIEDGLSATAAGSRINVMGGRWNGSTLTGGTLELLAGIGDDANGSITLGNDNGLFATASESRFTMNVPVGLKGYTVATLPTGTQGDVAFVTDATAPTYLGALTGGGAVVTPVFYNGAAWVSY